MKILVISYMYPSPANKVLGIFVHKQVQKLIENNCEVRVICPVPYLPKILSLNKKWEWYYKIPKKDIIDGVEVYYPRYLDFPKGLFLQNSGYFMYLGIKNTIQKLYKEYKFDIIHSHAVLPVGYAGMLVNKKYNIPHVITVHGKDFQYTLFKNKKCKENILKTLKSADKIVAVSNKLRNVITDARIKEKIVVINNGINLQEHEVHNGTIENEDIDMLSISFSLIKTKGIDINIRAVSIIKLKYPNFKYYIIGSGDEENNLKELVVELKLEKNVVFLGTLNHEEAMKYMDKCKVFSLPSWLEGFGIVYIEAMSHSKPVIAIRGQGIEDVIVDGVNGFLLEAKNYEKVANVVLELMENPLKAKMIGACGKKTVLEGLTWNKNAQKNIEIYRNIISNRGDL